MDNLQEIVVKFLNHLEDVLSEKESDKIDTKLWNELGALAARSAASEGRGALTEMCPTCGERYAKGVACDLCVPQPTESTAREALRGAVARGYCHEKNSHKVLDGDLLEAIVDEVQAALACGGTGKGSENE